ncbi:MAG: hypothetical protein QXI59_08180 [Candidatus Bathyarchaeia archaeon]
MYHCSSVNNHPLQEDGKEGEGPIAHPPKIDDEKSVHSERAGRCLVCGRKPDRGDLCTIHRIAKDKIVEAYRLWRIAYGSIDYKTYLENLIQIPETGSAVVEVAKMLLQRGDEDIEDTDNLREG